MNPAIYGSLPGSACTLGTEGTFGPDRIARNTYDAADRLTLVESAVGTSRIWPLLGDIHAKYSDRSASTYNSKLCDFAGTEPT